VPSWGPIYINKFIADRTTVMGFRSQWMVVLYEEDDVYMKILSI
jgi:hypothetical protein